MQTFDSKSKQDQFNKEMNRRAAEFISNALSPELDALLRNEGIGLSAAVDETDPHVINIKYPAAFSETYIRQRSGLRSAHARKLHHSRASL